jgi:hypothetical protein
MLKSDTKTAKTHHHKQPQKDNHDVKFEFEPIQEAVTFRPSIDDFADPLAYINQIRHIAENYGICKIIPPKTWRPTFCIDMNAFKFTPRVQRLNELEAKTRIKINFLERLSQFWDLQGGKFRIPILERKPIDLYKLYKTVEQMGGIEQVTKNKQWSQLIKKLDLKDANSARYVKTHYDKILYPFLLFEAGVTLPQVAAKSSLPGKQPQSDIESSYSSFDDEVSLGSCSANTNNSRKRARNANAKITTRSKKQQQPAEKVQQILQRVNLVQNC